MNSDVEKKLIKTASEAIIWGKILSSTSDSDVKKVGSELIYKLSNELDNVCFGVEEENE